MTPTTYQTVRLLPGKHRSPDGGACVMELASMLAGEPFTDRPASACRVIAALLRGYNDTVGDDSRQALLRFASEVVGTRSSETIEHARLRRCFAAFDLLEVQQRHSMRRRLSPVMAWEVRHLRDRAHLPQHLDDFGRAMARYFHRAGPRGDERFLCLLEELIAMRDDRPAPLVRPVAANTARTTASR